MNLKYGRDPVLEKLADQLLCESVDDSSPAEEVRHVLDPVLAGELQQGEPINDGDTSDGNDRLTVEQIRAHIENAYRHRPLYQGRALLEVMHRRRRTEALPGTPDPHSARIWNEVYDCDDRWEPTRLHAIFIAAGHGYRITEQIRRPLGYAPTCFCGSPIIHPARGIQCEFAIPWDECRCNGCILNTEPGSGRPRAYCSDKCKVRMRKAVNRARRRAEGKITRIVDEIADPIAELVIVYPKSRNT